MLIQKPEKKEIILSLTAYILSLAGFAAVFLTSHNLVYAVCCGGFFLVLRSLIYLLFSDTPRSFPVISGITEAVGVVLFLKALAVIIKL